MKVAEAFVELRIDDRRAQAEVRQRASSLGGTFAQVFGAAAFGAGAKKAIDAASAFEQSMGAVESVLGRSSKAVQKWADDAAKSMGLSKTAANNALALMVAQLKNFGFSLDDATDKGMDLVALGADLAATYGGSTTDAVQALTAAFRGEMDPIERYAISLNEARLKAKALELGLYDGVGALDMNTKAQAVLALITEQSASAQGQFARESRTAAGAQAIAAAEAENAAISFGDKLLPIYTRVTDVVGWLANGFAALPAPLQYATLGLAAIVALSGPFSTLKTMIQGAITAIQNMGTAGRVTAVSMGLLGGLVTVATLAYGEYAKSKAEAKARTDEFVAALQAEAKGQKNAALAAVAAQIDTAEMARLARENGASMEDVAKFIMGEYVPALDMLTTASGDAGVMFNTAESSAGEFSTELSRLKGEFSDAKDQVALTGAVLNEVGLTADETGDDIAGLGDDADEATKMIADLEAAFAGLIGTLDVRDAARNAAEGFDKITEAYAAIYDATDKRPLDEKIRDWQQAIDDQKRSVIDWATEMGNVPTSTVTDIMALIDEGSFEEAERRILALTARRNLVIDAKQIQTPFAANNATLNKFDRGGYIDRDQVAMIHRNEVVLPLNNPGRVAALLGDPRVAPSVAGVLGGGGQGGPSLSIGSLSVGSRDDLGATTNELGRLLWRVS